MKQNTKKIIIRVDGHKRIGMGHIHRTITLAKYIREHYKHEVVFITRNNKASQELLDRNQFKYFLLQFNISRKVETKNIKDIIKTEKPDVIIIDVLKSCFDEEYVNAFRRSSNTCIVAFIDNHRKSVVNADIVFNTSLYQKNEYYKDIKETKYYLGFDYLIIPEKYIGVQRRNIINGPVRKVIICMGGADHHNLTFKVLKTIDKSHHDFECDVVLSSSFFQKINVERILKRIHHKISIYYDVDSLFDLFKTADLAITAGGYTHIERIFSGIPGIVINQLVHQAQFSKMIAKYMATVDLGLYKYVSSQCILKSFNDLIDNADLRKHISQQGIKLVNGRGLENISKIIFNQG
jgi:UDP-2,4-diacetamido-2,4,6-trideoxy-beta-L-altropyranose hydrolase